MTDRLCQPMNRDRFAEDQFAEDFYHLEDSLYISGLREREETFSNLFSSHSALDSFRFFCKSARAILQLL